MALRPEINRRIGVETTGLGKSLDSAKSDIKGLQKDSAKQSVRIDEIKERQSRNEAQLESHKNLMNERNFNNKEEHKNIKIDIHDIKKQFIETNKNINGLVWKIPGLIIALFASIIGIIAAIIKIVGA